MGKAMKFIGPAMGAGELGLGIATMNPLLMAGGAGTLASGIGGALQKPPGIGQSASPTIPTQGVQPDLSSMLGGGVSGLSGSLAGTSGGGGMDSGMGGGTTFGSLGANDLQGLLSKILQGAAGGSF